MNKSDLKKVIADNEKVSQKVAEEYINAVFEAIQAGLLKEGKVSIHGVGTWEIKETKESSGVLNGKEWHKDAGKKIVVKVSDSFEKEVIE